MGKILIAVREASWGRIVASLLENEKHEIFYSRDKQSTLNLVKEVSLDASLMDFNIAKSALEETLVKLPDLVVAVIGNLPKNRAEKKIFKTDLEKIEKSNVKYFERSGYFAEPITSYLNESLSYKIQA